MRRREIEVWARNDADGLSMTLPVSMPAAFACCRSCRSSLAANAARRARRVASPSHQPPAKLLPCSPASFLPLSTGQGVDIMRKAPAESRSEFVGIAGKAQWSRHATVSVPCGYKPAPAGGVGVRGPAPVPVVASCRLTPAPSSTSHVAQVSRMVEKRRGATPEHDGRERFTETARNAFRQTAR